MTSRSNTGNFYSHDLHAKKSRMDVSFINYPPLPYPREVPLINYKKAARKI